MTGLGPRLLVLEERAQALAKTSVRLRLDATRLALQAEQLLLASGAERLLRRAAQSETVREG